MTTVRNSNTFICDAASVVDQRPFTPLPSQTAPHPLVEASVVTTTQRDTMPIVPDAVSNQGVYEIASAFRHLETTITLRCVSVTALSLIDRYHIWNGRIRNIPNGSAIAALTGVGSAATRLTVPVRTGARISWCHSSV